MDIVTQLKSVIREELMAIQPEIENFPWESERHYGTWCVQTYKFVYHTVPLLEKTASSVTGPLKEILQHHRSEELGHEKFAQRDAAFFGRDCLAESEMAETLSLYKYLLSAKEDLLESLFGYAFALENISATYCGYMADRVLKKQHKEPVKNHLANVPASFLTLHAAVDVEHTESSWDCLQYLSPDRFDGLINATHQSFRKYKALLHAIAHQQSALANKAA